MSKKNKSESDTSILKEFTGIRAAVKCGQISPELALHHLREAQKKGEFVGEDIVSWLNRRKKMLKNNPTSVKVKEESVDESS